MLVNKDAYQRETLTKWPVRLPLKEDILDTSVNEHVFLNQKHLVKWVSLTPFYLFIFFLVPFGDKILPKSAHFVDRSICTLYPYVYNVCGHVRDNRMVTNMYLVKMFRSWDMIYASNQ